MNGVLLPSFYIPCSNPTFIFLPLLDAAGDEYERAKRPKGCKKPKVKAEKYI